MGEQRRAIAVALERIEQRLTALDHLFTEAVDNLNRSERRQLRTQKRVDWLERIEMSRMERPQ